MTVCGNSADSRRAQGCLFVETGREQQVADRIMLEVPGVTAFAAKREKHVTVKGVKSRTVDVMLPGYVFFEAPEDIEPWKAFSKDHIIRVLTSEKNRWQLMGEDARFVKWLIRYGGVLGFSEACREGDRIRIVSGPLKDMEGSILKIDKRGRSGKVALDFNGRTTAVWLGFSLIEPAGGLKQEMASDETRAD